jgi:DNA-binding response OmpR family regulator
MKKILLIEDDQIVGNVYRNKLAVDGYKVELANDGRLGLDLANSFRPDLVILDLMLPDLSGVDIMKQLRSQPEFEKLPIIVFSNTYLSNIIKEAWKAGATKCFSKANCTPKQILEAVHSLLDEAPATAAEAAPKMEKEVPAAPSLKLKMAGESNVKPDAGPNLAEEFAKIFPTALLNLRNLHQALVKSSGEAAQLQKLGEMGVQIHGLTGSASLANLNALARVTDALEALVHELHAKPASINASTLRTVASAIDFLEVLYRRGSVLDAKRALSFNILVVDDELLSRRAVTHALEKAKLPSTDIDDPLAAFKLLSENSYDLVILDAEMPGMNGFELCAKLRGLPLHKKTPVVFVTMLNGFDARANSTMAGANDFIAKPFLFIELAVKALVFVLRGRIEASKAS